MVSRRISQGLRRSRLPCFGLANGDSDADGDAGLPNHFENMYRDYWSGRRPRRVAGSSTRVPYQQTALPGDLDAYQRYFEQKQGQRSRHDRLITVGIALLLAALILFGVVGVVESTFPTLTR